MYLFFVQCDIVNFHLRDFLLEMPISVTSSPRKNSLAGGFNLITFANVVRDTKMSVDIQRVISDVVIVTCCNINPPAERTSGVVKSGSD